MSGTSDITSAGSNNPYVFFKEDSENSYLKVLKEMENVADGMEKAAKDAPIAGSKQLLGSLVKQCEMMSNATYTARSWNSLMSVYAKAKKLTLSDNPTLKELKKAINELNGALSSLERAEINRQKEEHEEERKQGLPLVLKMDGGGSTQTVSSAATGASAAMPAVSAAATPAAAAPAANVDISV